MSMNRNLLHFLKMHYQTRQDSELPLFGLILTDNERNHLKIDLYDKLRAICFRRIFIKSSVLYNSTSIFFIYNFSIFDANFLRYLFNS